MWGQPMFGLKDPAAVIYELNECRKVYKNRMYIRVSAFDATSGWESVRLSFLTDRPEDEPSFALQRREVDG
jgi:ribulose-bisphosphate carboxylase small chain